MLAISRECRIDSVRRSNHVTNFDACVTTQFQGSVARLALGELDVFAFGADVAGGNRPPAESRYQSRLERPSFRVNLN